jgi:RNA polymerase sigma-70 factor (ECF subfamily)
LTPTERAAYILREAFDYAYRDIASVLRLAEANARQVVTRARRHLVSGRPTATRSTDHERLLQAFMAAAQDGDLTVLEDLFASNVVSTSDEFVRAA